MNQLSSNGTAQKRGSATTVKACDLCRKRKRRCIWTSGSQGCTPCTNLKEKCTTTHVRKQRSRPHKPSNRISEYESRIKNLESLLRERNAAQPRVDRQPLLNDLESPFPVSTWVDNLRQDIETMPRPPDPNIDPFVQNLNHSLGTDPAENVLDELSVEAYNADMFISEMTLPQGVDDVTLSKEFRADAVLLQNMELGPSGVLSEANGIDQPVVDQCDNDWPPPMPSQCQCDWYLPPPEVGTSLLAEYLTDFNTAVPLYQPHVIAEHLRVCYAGESDGSSVAWTSAYVVFGLAHVVRASSVTGSRYDNEMARYYLSRIYHALNGLLTAPPSQGLVQCLLGVAALIASTPCHYHMSEGHFISTALRVMQGLTYQDEEEGPTNDTRDRDQERRVFWLAFISDTAQSIMTNSPTTHRHEDVIGCAVDMRPDGRGVVTAAEGHWQVDIFLLRVKLANLQAEAIDQIISPTRSRNATTLDVEAAAAIVLARLERFHSHEVFQLGPDQLFILLYKSDLCHIVSLEADYFATVYRVHALLALGKNAKVNPFSLDGLRRVAEVKKHASLEKAKRLLSLLPIAPRGDVAMYWISHRVFIAALVTVFAHHINNSEAPALRMSEMRAYEQVLADIGTMVEEHPHPELSQARDFCSDLFLKLELSSNV